MFVYSLRETRHRPQLLIQILVQLFLPMGEGRIEPYFLRRLFAAALGIKVLRRRFRPQVACRTFGHAGHRRHQLAGAAR